MIGLAFIGLSQRHKIRLQLYLEKQLYIKFDRFLVNPSCRSCPSCPSCPSCRAHFPVNAPESLNFKSKFNPKELLFQTLL